MFVARQKYLRLVVFHNGKRTEKRVRATPDSLNAVKSKAKSLRERGVKCHIVVLTSSRLFPPTHEIGTNRWEGKMWCPYCGAWRWFRVPKPYHDSTAWVEGEPVSREFFLTSCWRQSIKVCSWCEISENDWYVKKANGSFAERPTRRRKRGRRMKLRNRGGR